MPQTYLPLSYRSVVRLVLAVLVIGSVATTNNAQQLTRPVYRVANAVAEEPVAQPAVAQPALAAQPTVAQPEPAQPLAATPPAGEPRFDPQVQPAAAQAAATPFDLEQRPGEHPLMPCLRLAKGALVDMQQRIQDYSATLTKRERLNGQLGDPQKLLVRVRHQPFSVYTKFVTPKPGQEALYVANQNAGKLVAMGSGWKRRFGKIKLDPEGSLAMADQRYPITKMGIYNLTDELVEIAERDVKYGECEVRHGPSRIDGRPATMIEAVHPVPRKNFRFHKAQIFIDNELRIPVAYRAYTWPQPGGEPILEEQYIYTDIKLNNGFTDADFSPENPEFFQ